LIINKYTTKLQHDLTIIELKKVIEQIKAIKDEGKKKQRSEQLKQLIDKYDTLSEEERRMII
jgi:isopropylmalate/homocitrate/citramalate synthase